MLRCGLFRLSLSLLSVDTVMVYKFPAITGRSLNDVISAGSVSVQLSPSLGVQLSLYSELLGAVMVQALVPEIQS